MTILKDLSNTPLECGKLDLLGLDLQGHLVVIEIKRGMINRDSIAQAIDYASAAACVECDELFAKVDEYLSGKSPKANLTAMMEDRGSEIGETKESREVRLFVVGTGKQEGLERIVQFLSRYQMPISIVSYEIFEVADGQRILIRELAEEEIEPLPVKKNKVTLEQLCMTADQCGIGEGFRLIRTAAEKHNLYPRLWATSVMYTPPSNRKRMLFTVWVKSRTNNMLKIYVGTDVFPEFYPVRAKEARQYLGPDGWREMNKTDVEKFIDGLDRLFAQIEKTR